MSLIFQLRSSIRQRLGHLPSTSIGYRLAHGACWSLAGAVTSRGLGLLASVLVARILGKVGFGELAMVQSTVGMFGTFAGFGLGLTATKFIAEYRVSDPAKAARIRGLSSLFAWFTSSLASVTLFAIAGILSDRLLAAPQLTSFIRIGTLFLFFTSLNGAQVGALSGFEAFKPVARISVGCGLLNFPFMVGGVYWAGIKGALWGMTAVAVVNWFLNHLAIRRECQKHQVPFTYKDCWREKRVLWEFSFPALLSGSLTGPVMWGASALLVNQPHGYAEMGIYNAIFRIKQVPEMILAMVMAPILPVLSEQFGTRSSDNYSKILKYAFGLSALIVVPFSLVQIAAPQITLLPYGSEYQGHQDVVQLLMLQTIFVGLFNPIGSVLSSMNKMWTGFSINLVWGGIYLGIASLCIPRYGAAGLAWAFLISHSLVSLIGVYFVCRLNRQFPINLSLSKILILVFVLLVACFTGSLTNVIQVSVSSGVLSTAALVIFLFRWKYIDLRLKPTS